MFSSKITKTAASIAVCVFLGACSQDQPAPTSPSASSEESSSQATPSTSSETTPRSASTSATKSTATGSAQAAPSPEPVDDKCDTSTNNPLSKVESLPIISSGGLRFSFSITEEHFDPCADLSWSVIAGGVGTGNSLRQGVVFFHDGHPISNPAPLMQERVTAVTPLGGNTVQVSYEVLEGPRAAGQVAPGSATFALTEQGSLAITENTLPLSANEAGIQLDVTNL